MTRFWQLLCICPTVAAVLAIAASAASAGTFYVNERSGSDSNKCERPAEAKPPTKVGPCQTIARAVEASEAVSGPNTIEVAEGEYHEGALLLGSHADDGLTINGEEEGVEILSGSGPAVAVNSSAVAVTLSNLKLRKSTGSGAAVKDLGAALTLDDVVVESESGINGVEASKAGSLTIDGGTFEMESGPTGYAVSAVETPLAVMGATIKDGGASEPEAGGILSEKSGLTVTDTNVDVEGGVSEEDTGISAVEDGSVSLREVTVRQDSPALGLALELSPTTAERLTVEMERGSSKADGVGISAMTATSNSSFDHLVIGGAWKGPGLLGIGGNVTLADSRLITSSEHEAEALVFVGLTEGKGLLVQRSVLQAPPSSPLGVLYVQSANVTLDSSEVLGGLSGIALEDSLEGTRTLTVAASTIDAGAPGILDDASGVTGVDAFAKGAATVTSVAIEGSIVLERQVADDDNGGQANVACTYTAAPSQTQIAKGGEGQIGCGAGAAGDTEAAPISSLFSEPFADYGLSPASSAIASVPASAIALPFGIAPSATDLAGNPRAGDGADACFTSQDKGALELQGHLLTCPIEVISAKLPIATTPIAPKPLAGILSGLTLSPDSFLPAHGGATLSKPKGRLGTKITYRDSQAATTIFTVELPLPGRMQGHSCKKPSRTNKHGKRCTRYKPLGTFTHADRAGANSLHFSGRLLGKKLAKGVYRLQAIATDAAGKGHAVDKRFTIK